MPSQSKRRPSASYQQSTALPRDSQQACTVPQPAPTVVGAHFFTLPPPYEPLEPPYEPLDEPPPEELPLCDAQVPSVLQ